MRKASLSVGSVLVFAIVGCKVSDRPVFVDLQRLEGARPNQFVETPIPTPPIPVPAFIGILPGTRAIYLRDPANTPKLNVRQMFQDEQLKSFEQLRKRLLQFYLNEARKFRLEQEQAIAGQEMIAYGKANSEIRKLFEDWAQQRSQTFAMLALMAGFPDPNPTSQPSPRNLRPVEKYKFDSAAKLRSALQAIDDHFALKVRAVLSEVLDRTSADQAELQLRIAQFTNDLAKRAEREARAQIRDADSKLELKLSDPAPLVYDASPPKLLQISPQTTPEPGPRPPSDGILHGAVDDRLVLKQELQVWATTHHYRLVSRGVGVSDATQEFQLWRKQHGSGP